MMGDAPFCDVCGHITVRNGAQDIFHLSTVLTSEWGTVSYIHDIGPDFYFVEDGMLKVAITGRSLTGSGNIGRVVINLETGELESEAGRRLYEDFVANVCTALAPPSGS